MKSETISALTNTLEGHAIANHFVDVNKTIELPKKLEMTILLSSTKWPFRRSRSQREFEYGKDIVK